MKIYCVNCRKKTENLDSKIFKTKNDRLFMQSKCADWNEKVKIRERTRIKSLLSNLGLKTPLNKAPLLGDILF